MTDKSVYKKMKDYYKERYREFHEAFQILRQDLVNDLGREFRKHGIPATFKIHIDEVSVSMAVTNEAEFIDALVSGDEAKIEAAFEKYRAAFEMQRRENGSNDDD